MPKAFAQFWSALPISPGALYVHPDDLQWFQKNGRDVQAQSPTTFKEFIKSERFVKDDKELHLSLIPVPFVGNLEHANIFILLMNPGFSPSNYYEEEDPAFRAACVRNLHQFNGDDEFPFFCLNPEFAWSGGFIWWEALLRPILSKLLELKQFRTYHEALAFLAKKIATIELIPYHSRNGQAISGRGNPWKYLPSAIAARQFVQRLWQSPQQPLIVVARSHEKWDIPDRARPNVVTCPRTRGVTFNPELPKESGEAGLKILEYLGYPSLTR